MLADSFARTPRIRLRKLPSQQYDCDHRRHHSYQQRGNSHTSESTTITLTTRMPLMTSWQICFERTAAATVSPTAQWQ
jgi:hypothetical protein